jgi:preprotein translocase subunit SecG
MGGFMLYINGKPRATLEPNELLGFVREGSVEIPIIMEADIEDRSKGDALSKGIAILQLAWFVLQLVARYVQNLPITLLEIDTLAVAVLTCIAYGLWWKKPKDVRRPHAVYWKTNTSLPNELAYEQVDVGSPTESWGVFLVNCVYPVASLMGLGAPISSRAVHSRRVSSVGGYDNISVFSRPSIILSIGCLSGAVFGGIHCLGWNDLFQGHAEQILWRAASLAIVSAPVSILLLWGCAIWLNSLDEVSMSFAVSRTLASLVPLASIFIYIVARIILIVLILMSFQSLPPGTYDTVAWTNFIPHL